MSSVTQEFLQVPAIQQMLNDTEIVLAGIKTTPFLGNDIAWEWSDDGWVIELYPHLYYDGPVFEMVCMALANIYHHSHPLYVETPGEEFDRLSDIYVTKRKLDPSDAEDCKRSLVAIDSAIGVAFLARFLLEKQYLNSSQIRTLAEYQSERIISIRSAVEALSAGAVLRGNGVAASLVRRVLVDNKWYDLLVIGDVIDAIFSSGKILHQDDAVIYELFSEAEASRSDLTRRVAFLRNFTLGGAARPEKEYDVAISFADDDRPVAEGIAHMLRSRGYRVFDNSSSQADLWGTDLVYRFNTIYRESARYCLILISNSYRRSLQAGQQLKAALARSFEDDYEYVLPLRLDDTEIEGILPTKGSIDLRSTTVSHVVDLLVEKLELR
jgi:hypothetical protein